MKHPMHPLVGVGLPARRDPVTDYEWRAQMPGEAVRQGRAAIASPSSRPTQPSGSARTGLDGHGPVSVLREAEAVAAADAGAGTGAVVPAAAPVSQLLVVDAIRGAWWR